MTLPDVFLKLAPNDGLRLPLSNEPKALLVLPAVPKLYVSPVLELPVPAVYVVFALEPVSKKTQPEGKVELVPELASVLKSCV